MRTLWAFWRNQFTNYLYTYQHAKLVWAQVWVWNLLFWAIVLLTYIISPHGEVYLLEKCCYVFAQYDALHYLVSAPLLRGKLRCQLKLLKKVWIYSNNLWCVLDGAESTQQRRHVSLYTFRWWCLVEIICISIQTSIHRLHTLIQLSSLKNFYS